MTRYSRPHRRITTVDILDRVLDRGLVIDSHSRVSMAGIDSLLTTDARDVVTSFDTHRRYTELPRPVARPRWRRPAP